MEISGGLSLTILPPVGVALLAMGSVVLLTGTIRWAVTPLMEQNEEILRALRERKDTF
jgi:hypothetical protein